MLTDNGQKIFSLISDNSSSTFTDTNNSVKQISLSEIKSVMRYYGTSSATRVVIGTSDEPSTLETYKLINSVGSNMVIINGSVSYGNNNILYQAISTYRNKSTDPIIIKEVGILTNYCTSAVYQTYVDFLIARAVLDNPITIQPNELYTFTYTLQ